MTMSRDGSFRLANGDGGGFALQDRSYAVCSGSARSGFPKEVLEDGQVTIERSAVVVSKVAFESLQLVRR